MANSPRVLFVGGCHINGFPVGEEYAFTHQALRALPNADVQCHNTLPLINLHSGPQILAACDELKPDAIVLQLGHYESPGSVRKIMGLSASMKARRRSLGADCPPHPEMRYRPTFVIMLAELRRIVAAGLLIAVGKKTKIFNPAAITGSLDSIISSLKELPLRGIVLVGPFSAPDPFTRFFRRHAASIFEAAAKKHDCIFIDVFSYLESYSPGEAFRANFADREHLSVLGHQRVGALVGSALKRVLEESTAPGAEFVTAAPIKEAGRAARPGWAGRPVVAMRS